MPQEATPAIDLTAGTRTARAMMALRDLIVTGAMAPGLRITEVQLAERLDMSRTPVRAALQQLRTEGLLEPHPQGGFTVRGFLPQEIAEAIELRGMIEGLAARRLAEAGVAPRVLAALARTLDDIDAILETPVFDAAQVLAYSDANVEFHAGLIAATGSVLLQQEVERANARPFAAASALVRLNENMERSRRHLTVAQDQHRAMLEAIAAREGARAEALLREHARLSQRNLTRALQLQLPLDDLPGAGLIRRTN